MPSPILKKEEQLTVEEFLARVRVRVRVETERGCSAAELRQLLCRILAPQLASLMRLRSGLEEMLSELQAEDPRRDAVMTTLNLVMWSIEAK